MGTVWEGQSEKAQRRTHVWEAGWRVHSRAAEKALEGRAGAAEGGAAARGSAASPPAFVRASSCRGSPAWGGEGWGGEHSGPLRGAGPTSLALGDSVWGFALRCRPVPHIRPSTRSGHTPPPPVPSRRDVPVRAQGLGTRTPCGGADRAGGSRQTKPGESASTSVRGR